MIRLKFIILFSFFCLSLFAKEAPISEEAAIMGSLIAATKKSLGIQEKIKEQLIQYQKINQAFLQHPENPELLFQMLTTAGPLFKNLQSFHLIENFSSEFISELKLFSDMNAKGNKP